MRIIVFFGVLLIGSCALGQTTVIKNDYLFSQLTVKEGLSINEPNAVFQDSRGFIWICTTDGLNPYTGNNIIVFRNDPKDSLFPTTWFTRYVKTRIKTCGYLLHVE